eukprot:TRINITY_DN14608_c0_g1_i1.p1 TRINITY_DN14608_c0_g1~~TRINITY_DN14608_c0_g1_i1.p1  ORF type:complete len:197 (+),score=17.28 TRINITY_DN14608_c0_g1_i1:74-664(+)
MAAVSEAETGLSSIQDFAQGMLVESEYIARTLHDLGHQLAGDRAFRLTNCLEVFCNSVGRSPMVDIHSDDALRIQLKHKLRWDDLSDPELIECCLVQIDRLLEWLRTLNRLVLEYRCVPKKFDETWFDGLIETCTTVRSLVAGLVPPQPEAASMLRLVSKPVIDHVGLDHVGLDESIYNASVAVTRSNFGGCLSSD